MNTNKSFIRVHSCLFVAHNLLRDSSSTRIVRTQLYFDPVARNQPDEIPFHYTHQVGQNPMLIFQHHFINRARPLSDH